MLITFRDLQRVQDVPHVHGLLLGSEHYFHWNLYPRDDIHAVRLAHGGELGGHQADLIRFLSPDDHSCAVLFSRSVDDDSNQRLQKGKESDVHLFLSGNATCPSV